MGTGIFGGGPLDDVEREVPDPPPTRFEEPYEIDGQPVFAVYIRRNLQGGPFPDAHGRQVYVYFKTERGRPSPPQPASRPRRGRRPRGRY